jgi:hypothetical protein
MGEAPAVIAYGQSERALVGGKDDVYASSVGVPRDIGEGFLTHAKDACGGGGACLNQGRKLNDALDARSAPEVGGEPFDGGSKITVAESDEPEFGGDPADLGRRGVDRYGIDVGGESAQSIENFGGFVFFTLERVRHRVEGPGEATDFAFFGKASALELTSRRNAFGHMDDAAEGSNHVTIAVAPGDAEDEAGDCEESGHMKEQSLAGRPKYVGRADPENDGEAIGGIDLGENIEAADAAFAGDLAIETALRGDTLLTFRSFGAGSELRGRRTEAAITRRAPSGSILTNSATGMTGSPLITAGRTGRTTRWPGRVCRAIRASSGVMGNPVTGESC